MPNVNLVHNIMYVESKNFGHMTQGKLKSIAKPYLESDNFLHMIHLKFKLYSYFITFCVLFGESFTKKTLSIGTVLRESRRVLLYII